MKKVIVTFSSEETENAGYELAKTLKCGDFVAMFGDLGVGKTAFTRGVARYISPGARVQSPTYTIVNEYKGNPRLFHFDMYRIDGEEALYSTGFFDYIEEGICISEWCENIENFIPENHIKVTIEKDFSSQNADKRIITIEDNNENTCS